MKLLRRKGGGLLGCEGRRMKTSDPIGQRLEISQEREGVGGGIGGGRGEVDREGKGISARKKTHEDADAVRKKFCNRYRERGKEKLFIYPGKKERHLEREQGIRPGGGKGSESSPYVIGGTG